MKSDPIKYKDLVQPDDSITNAVKQLDELNDAYMNTQNNIRGEAIKLKASLTNLNSATVQHREAIKNSSMEAKKLENAQKQLAYTYSEVAKEVTALQEDRKQEARMLSLNHKLATAAEGSYNKLSAQYSINKELLNSMSLAERENTEEGRKLVEQTREIYEEMHRLQKETGKNQLNVGNYEQAVSSALGPLKDWKNVIFQTGGNLEAMREQLNNAIVGVKGLGKQLLKLLANPIVLAIGAIVAVFTALYAVFKKVVNVAKSNEEQAVKLEKAMAPIRYVGDAITRMFEDMADVFIKIVGTVTSMITAFTDFVGITKGMQEEVQKYIDLENDRLNLNKEIREETVKASERELEVAQLRDKVAQKDKYNEKERIEMLDRAIALEKETAKEKERIAKERLRQLEVEAERTANSAEFEDKLAEARADVNRATTELYRSTRRLNAERSRTILEIEGEKKAEEKAAQERAKKAVEAAEQARVAAIAVMRKETQDKRKTEDVKIRLMQDGADKELAILSAQYNREIENLKIRLATEKDLTEASRKEINETILALLAEFNNKRSDLMDDQYMNDLNRERERISLMLEGVVRGSEREHDLRMAQLEINRKQELEANRKLPEALRQSEADINAAYNRLAISQRDQFNKEKAMLDFEANEMLKQTEFDLLITTEAEKTRYRLESEKRRIQKILELNKDAAVKLSDIEVEAMKNTIAKIDQEIDKSTRTEKKDIYSAIGLKLDDDQKEAISTSTDFALSQFSSILAMNTQMAEQALQAANERVDAAKSTLDLEMEARSKGLAHNVDLARKELEEEKKNQEKALKDKQKAQRAQQRLDTVTQSASLITASAQIWKSLSGIPIVGPALAVAAIGTMWGSFAASKIKANQMTKKEYGKGGLEFLEGGSHASGNDIPIGTTTDGRQRAAEGGEALAIINKRNTSKYKDVLPDVVDSLNNGTFEKEFMRQFENSGVGMNVVNVNTDLSKIEDSLDAIKSQGGRSYYVDKKGRLVERYKNITIKHN